MSTKGASNRYPTTRNGNHHMTSGHINYAWAKAFNKRTLYDHFRRHGEQMKCDTQEAYAAKAVKFANTIDKKNCISFVAKNGTTFKFNKKDGTFAVIIKEKIVVTYFKPKEGIAYYRHQIELNKKK